MLNLTLNRLNKMGIKNINKTAEKESPRAFTRVKVSSLKNKFVAVDSALWLYTNMSTATKQVVAYMKDILEEIDRGELMQKCIASALKFHTYMLRNEICLVWIRDGKTPKEKTATRAKRREAREEKADKISYMKDILNEQDILLRDPTDMDALRKLLIYNVIIYKEEFETFYNVLYGLGIPIIDAPGEAEAYACSLNRKGIVYGVWSTDTDCYALEGINMITGFEGKNEDNEDMLSVVHIPYLLEDMEFDTDQMRDFCIMCGTDFNDNIPNIGDGRAYKYIQKHGNIEEFEKSILNDKKKCDKIDCSILNYERSRELLTPPECDLNFNSIKLRFSIERFRDTGKDLSVQYGLSQYYVQLEGFMENEFSLTKYDVKSGPHAKKKGPVIMVKGKIVNKKDDSQPKKELEVNEEVTCLADILAGNFKCKDDNDDEEEKDEGETKTKKKNTTLSTKAKISIKKKVVKLE